MTAIENVTPAHASWDLAQLATLRGSHDLVLIPERVEMSPDGAVTAIFREETQDLRAAALEAGLTVAIAAPAEAKIGILDEYSGDWIVPLLLEDGVWAIYVSLIADWISKRAFDRGPKATVKVRLVRIEGANAEVREIEGTPEEVDAVLRRLEPGTGTPPGA
ncbi:hypothetical protein EON81_25225 [bacterium]|nr:MAG: hypothetical protein EON81_25225 [bacterium]